MIREMLARPWPDDPQPGALYERCLDIVKAASGDAGKEDADPAALSERLAWHVLADLLEDPTLPDPVTSAQLAFAALGDAIARAGTETLKGVASLLGKERLANEHLSTEALKDWAATKDPLILSTVVKLLAGRGEHEWLAELGSARDPEEQILILRHLAREQAAPPHSRSHRDPAGEQERRFWRHCAETQPTQTVGALYYGGGLMGHPPVNLHNRSLRGPLVAFLAREAKRTDWPEGEQIHPIRQVVEFVGGWRNREDAPLLRELLSHPGFDSYQVSSSVEPRRYERRDYRVRRAAKNALFAMGEMVPEGVVLEEKIVGDGE